MNKRILLILLTCVFIIALIPNVSFAADNSYSFTSNELVFSYSASEEAVVTEIGTAKTGSEKFTGKVYCISLPSGSTITSLKWNSEYGVARIFNKTGFVGDWEPTTIWNDVDNYFMDSDFSDAFSTDTANAKNTVYCTFYDNTPLPVNGVKGIAGYARHLTNMTLNVFYIQISNTETPTNPTITIGSKEANPGDEITVPVTIADNPGFKGFTAVPSYDKSALELTAVSLGDITEDGNIEYDGETVTGDSLTDLTFKVKDSAEAGDYDIGLDMDAFYDSEGNDIEAEVVPGKVTVIVTAAQSVDRLIEALPGEVTLDDKAQIEAARAAYDALTEEEKATVSEISVAKLELAEAKLAAAQAEADKSAAEAAAAQAEADKQAAEAAAAQAEADKTAAEAAAAQAELDKQAAEAALTQAEADKEAAEAALAQAEADKQAAEEAKAQAEAAAAQAEADKQAAEKAKANAEAAAAQAELDKQAADEAVTKAEADKKAAEDAAKEAQEKQEAAEAEAAEVQAKLEEAEKTLAETQAKLEAAEKEAEAAKLAQQKAEAKNYKVTGLKVTVKNRKFTVKYKKNSKATGYQIQYKLKTAKKYTNLKKATTKLKATTKKLKKGKVYQFRVRTYTTIDGKKVYGQWSAVKSVKCK